MAIYTDIALSFKRHPFTNDVLVKTDADAVKQALYHLFFTSNYEKPFDPDFGLGLNRMMFENFDMIKRNVLEKKIINMVSHYEPRVKIENILIEYQHDSNDLQIGLEYYIIGMIDLQRINISFERVR